MTVSDGTVKGGTGEAGAASGREYRIDELAREAGTTVRTVRAYQERGLLPPARRAGRVVWYSDAHVARVRLIGTLLDRGYSLANIGELLEAWEHGQNIGELMGFEAVLTAPWSEERPVVMSVEDLLALFGETVSPDDLAQALNLGVLVPEGEGFRVDRPRLLEAGAELVRAGVPLAEALQIGKQLRRSMDTVARAFVELVATHVFDPLGDPLPPEDVPRLAELVRRLRPLAARVVDAELARAMESRVDAALGDHVARMLDALRRSDASSSS